MEIALGVLVMAIGFSAINLNFESNNPKEWIYTCGYIVMLLGFAIICKILF
jgi:hypothetical protein